MEPPPKRQRQHDHDTDGSFGQDEVAQPQSGGHRESNTHDGIGIQSKGNFTVGGDLHINVNNTMKEMEKIKREQQEKEEARKRLLESLRYSQMDAREFGIKKAHASTCRWILEKHQYQLWAQTRQKQGSDRLIWLKGKPGTGKSTMMKFLLEHIQGQFVTSDGNEVLVSFFFNARGNDLEKSALGMYRSLLLQLLQKKPEVQTVLDSLQPNHEWTIDSLESVLEQTLLCRDGATVTCLVDALDECGTSQARDMVGLFNRLTQTSNRLYVCFASRHYPHISIATSLEIVLEHQPEHRHDIERYVSSKLQIGSGQLVDEMCSDILAKSSGIFMWVVLVVDILNREFDAGRKHILRKRLGQLPKDLHELFRDILTRDTENGDGLLLCLKWLLFARKPLTPQELYFAMISGLEPDYLQTCHAEDISEDDIKKYILDTSKGLAEPVGYSRATVQFIHESIVDFLIKDNGLATIFSDVGNVIHGKSHDSLKICCLHYMDFVKSSDVHHRPKPATIRFFPFEEYAEKQIIFHANQSEAGGIYQKDIMAYLSRGKRTWQGSKDLNFPSPLYALAKECAASLIRAHPTDRSCLTVERQTYPMPIMAAAAAGSTETVLALLELKCRRLPALCFQDLFGRVPLHIRSDLNTAKTALGAFHRDMSIITYMAKFAPELASMVFLQTIETNVNVTDSQGQSLLFHAIHRDHCVLMEYLIEMGIDVSICDKEGRSASHWAAQCGSVRALAVLERGRCNINAHENSGRTPMHLAVSRTFVGPSMTNTVEMINALVQHGANIDAIDYRGQTPLHYAVQCFRLDALNALLQNKADTESRDEKGMTPLHYAVQHYRYNALDALLRNKANTASRDEKGMTPLHYAARIDWCDALYALLQNKADIESRDEKGLTPLHYSAWQVQKVQKNTLDMLLIRGACVNARDQEERTPLHYAFWTPSFKNAEILLSSEADVYAADKQGLTPLGHALWFHSSNAYTLTQAIELLKRFGLDVSAVDPRGETLLHWSLGKGLHECVVQLVNSGSDISKPDRNRYTPIWWAVYASRSDVRSIQFLIDRGANIRDSDGDGYTLLHRAVEQAKLDVVKVLVRNGASLKARNKYGQSAFDLALSLGFAEIVQFLSTYID